MQISADEPRTREEIDQIRSYLEHELWTLKETSTHLAQHGNRKGEIDQNAYMESFLLHASYLIDFFFPTPIDQQFGIVVQHFVEGWPDREEMPTLLEDTRELAEKALVRSTYRNLDLLSKEHLAAICEEMESLRSQFEQSLTEGET